MGAGAVGIELAFKLRNLNYQPNVEIIEAMPNILPSFSPKAIEIIIKELKNNNINLLLNSKISKVNFDHVLYNDNKSYFNLALWTCGIKSNDFIKQLTNKPFLEIDKNLRVINNINDIKNNIYAMGDIIASKDNPPTAQNAKQQGKYLAKYFNNNFKGEPFKYNEICKIIHTNNKIIIDSKYGVFTLPICFDFIIEWFTSN